jgi:hypothetical protein
MLHRQPGDTSSLAAAELPFMQPQALLQEEVRCWQLSFACVVADACHYVHVASSPRSTWICCLQRTPCYSSMSGHNCMCICRPLLMVAASRASSSMT